MNVKIRAALVVSCLSFVLGSTSHAEAARWRKAATCLKAAIESRGSVGSGRFVWAISCDSAGNGNNKVVYGTTHSAGNGESFWWKFTQSGGAAGTSIALKDSVPYVISSNNTVWHWAPNDLWFSYPTNRCEGGNVSMQQVLGEQSIAVAADSTIYVVEANGTPSNTLRKWTGSCWQRLPVLPDGSAKQVSIWDAAPAARNRPWVATTTGKFYRLTSANAWELIGGGQGYGVSPNYVIALDTSARWRINWNTGVFAQDTTWSGGAIRQQDDWWVVTLGGLTYHWE